MPLQNRFLLSHACALDFFQDRGTLGFPAVRSRFEVVVRKVDVDGGYKFVDAGKTLWGRDLAGRHASGDGTGGLLVVWSNGIGYLPQYDGRGNIWGFSGGYSRSLSAFGEVAFYPSGLPANMPIGLLTYAHGTKEYFSDLGLYNYGRRFYDPKTGRFIGRDPIQENGGLNLYAFVRNNPANLWDYLGMKYGDTHIDDERIPFGFYDVGDGIHACPYGSTWDGLYSCHKDESAPRGPRNGAIEMSIFNADASRFNRFSLDTSGAGRFSFPTPDFRGGIDNFPEEGGSGPGTDPGKEKARNDCFEAARAAHMSDTQKLSTLAELRIEAFFGSIAAQRNAALASFGFALASTLRDRAATIVGSTMFGRAFSSPWASAAAAGRNLYAVARSWQQINAIAAEVASLEATSRVVRGVSGTVFAVSYNVAISDSVSEAAFGAGSEVVDLLGGNNYSQTGILVGLSAATLQLIDESGLSKVQAAAVTAGIRGSAAQTQDVINDRLKSALSDCVQKFR